MAAEGVGPPKWEVGLREAQSASNSDVVVAEIVERGADGGNLSLEPVDELRAIAAADEQPRLSHPGGADLDLARPAFGVDDPDASRCDREVIDVSAGEKQPADAGVPPCSRARRPVRRHRSRMRRRGGARVYGLAPSHDRLQAGRSQTLRRALDERCRRCQRWRAARANSRPPVTRLAVKRTEMPIFAVDRGFVGPALWASRERCVSRELGFVLIRAGPELRRRAGVARRVAPVEVFDRFGARAVALRVLAPDLVSVAGLDVLRERAGLVTALAFVRRGLALGRGLVLSRDLAPGTLLWSLRVDSALAGAGALLASLAVPSAVLSEVARLLAARRLGFFAGEEGSGARARFFEARSLASDLPLLDARAPLERLVLVDV